MANAYATLIEAKRRTIDQVFLADREATLRILATKGLDGYGEKLVIEDK